MYRMGFMKSCTESSYLKVGIQFVRTIWCKDNL